LPDVFAARMGERFAWAVEPTRLHELADVMQGVVLAIHHLTRPGDGVVLHVPAYPPFLRAIEGTGRRVVGIPARAVDGWWSFDHDELDARLATDPATMLLLCHPHNPTGHVFDRAELVSVAEIAARHGLAVVSDEVHAELVHAPHGHVPFASLDEDVASRTITVTSASKAFNLAGLRWAALHAGHDGFREALQSLPSHYLGAPNLMAVAATEAAWTEGDGWLTAVRARLDANRTLLGELLAARLPAVRYVVPDATYLAWLDCRDCGMGDDPAEELRRRGVELSPGPAFGPEGIGCARLNFATSARVLERIVDAMATPPPGDDQRS
jgi:cystathionine beta-lyase